MSDAAPFIVFNSVKTFGICRQSGTVALTAVRFLRSNTDAASREVVDPDDAVVAHLRGDLEALRQLRQAIDEVERLFTARQQIAAAEATAGTSDATMQ